MCLAAFLLVSLSRLEAITPRPDENSLYRFNVKFIRIAFSLSPPIIHSLTLPQPIIPFVTPTTARSLIDKHNSSFHRLSLRVSHRLNQCLSTAIVPQPTNRTEHNNQPIITLQYQHFSLSLFPPKIAYFFFGFLLVTFLFASHSFMPTDDALHVLFFWVFGYVRY
jgi:hypothetical protein